jgi:hypothetical protein
MIEVELQASEEFWKKHAKEVWPKLMATAPRIGDFIWAESYQVAQVVAVLHKPNYRLAVWIKDGAGELEKVAS